MVQTKSRTVVLGGLIVALIGAMTVFVYAKSVTRHVGGETAQSAFVAMKDLPAGTTWDAATKAVASRPVPVSLRPAAAITSMKQLTGRTSVRPIAKGEVITTAQFGLNAAAPAAGLQIPPGHNAVTMNLAPPQGVANYAQAGDSINIYVTIKSPVPGIGTITKLLLSNVQVLANRSANAQASGSQSTGGGEVLLTLSLTPDQSERVIFSKENGSLWFGLVRPGDHPVSSGGRTALNVLN